jgi:iturin family lipopeptide synthetase B
MLPANELKNYLSETLPNYMIPAHFIPIAEIPLTPNGKLDRKALPENLSQESDQYIAPRNEKQKILVEIWAEVLNIDADVIGINTNFFELGGHSLNVALMTAKLHKRFDVKIPLIKIFENPTIEKIEGIISRSKTDEFKSIESVEEKDYYPLSSAQKRLFFMQLMDPENTSYNATSFSVLEGELLKKKFEDVFKTLIDRHEGLRTSFRLVEDRPAQRIHPQVDFCISYYEAGDKEAEAITDGFIQPFDLSQAPQLRVGLIKLAELKHVLMVDLHHITADGISMLILIKEFMAVYAGQSLPVLKVQYKDYARWQNSAPQQELIKQQEKYWEKEFSGNLPLLKLPLDYPRPPVQSFEGGKVYFTLGKEKVELLRKFSLEEDVTMYMLCLAIFFVFLYKLSGQEDLIIGTDSAGRGHPDLQNIIGMFVNTLAIRSYPGGEKTFRTFLKETKNRTLETFENQDYPFEELVEQLDVKRDLGRNPLFDVAFYFFNVDNMNPGDIPEVEIPGLIQKGYNKEDTTSKFDLSLMVDESEDKLSLTFEYCTKLFKKEKIEALVIIFQEILSTVLENRDIQLKDITVSHHLLVMNTQKREIQLNELDF